MDRYLELISEVYGKLTKIDADIVATEFKLKINGQKINKKRKYKKNLKKFIKKTNKTIELLKKYEGKDIFKVCLSSDIKEIKDDIKHQPKIWFCLFGLFIISPALMLWQSSSLLILKVVAYLAFEFLAFCFCIYMPAYSKSESIKNKIAGKTLSEERAKKDELEQELDKIKNDIQELANANKKLKKVISDLENRKKEYHTILEQVKNLRLQAFEKVANEEAMNHEFDCNPELGDILKRVKKEGK